MFNFTTKKKLREEIDQLCKQLNEARDERDAANSVRKEFQIKLEEARDDINDKASELIRLKNILEARDERIKKLNKRIATQQSIIDKQNEKLGITHEPKSRRESSPVPETKTREDRDPYPEE